MQNALTLPRRLSLLWPLILINTCLLLASPVQANPAAEPRLPMDELASVVKVGDIVYIDVPAYPFRQISLVTRNWVNHVGIVVQTGEEIVVAESALPLSRRTSLRKFIARSAQGRVAVQRLDHEWTEQELAQLQVASEKRMGILYDTGFNLHSQGQFCSRFVRELVLEATGISLGEVVDFSTLLKRNPEANLGFWRLWYLGRIPWARQTVTPASLYQEAHMLAVFDGYVSAN